MFYFIYIYKNFFTTLGKGLRKNIKKKERERDGEIGEHKLNEMGGLRMKYKN